MNKKLMKDTEALEKSIVLWTWLSENPSKHKSDYPFENLKKLDSECHLCNLYPMSPCFDCPMYGFWPSYHGVVNECQDNTSSFEEWAYCNDSLYDRSFFAAVLVEAFESRLAELVD